MDAPKFSPMATITTSTLFSGNTDKACSSVASMTKGCGNLFLQTIHPADAHVRTYHFVPQCRKLFCQHVTIIP